MVIAAVALGVDRVDDDRVDPGGDEVLDLAELLGDVVLGVLDLQRHAGQGLGVVDHAVAQHGQEVVVELGHRHADLGGEGGAGQHGGGGERKSKRFMSIPPWSAPRGANRFHVSPRRGVGASGAGRVHPCNKRSKQNQDRNKHSKKLMISSRLERVFICQGSVCALDSPPPVPQTLVGR